MKWNTLFFFFFCLTGNDEIHNMKHVQFRSCSLVFISVFFSFCFFSMLFALSGYVSVSVCGEATETPKWCTGSKFCQCFCISYLISHLYIVYTYTHKQICTVLERPREHGLNKRSVISILSTLAEIFKLPLKICNAGARQDARNVLLNCISTFIVCPVSFHPIRLISSNAPFFF